MSFIHRYKLISLFVGVVIGFFATIMMLVLDESTYPLSENIKTVFIGSAFIGLICWLAFWSYHPEFSKNARNRKRLNGDADHLYDSHSFHHNHNHHNFSNGDEGGDGGD